MMFSANFRRPHRVKKLVDVMACARCLQQLFGGINALLVAVQRLGVDADDLTALCL